jgi:hypothetical protein
MAVYGFITSRTTGNADGTGALNIYPAHPDCAIFRHNTDRTELQAFIAPHAESAMATPPAWVMRAETGAEDDDAIELAARLDYPLHWMNANSGAARGRRNMLPGGFCATRPSRAALVAVRYCSRIGAIFTDAPQRSTGPAVPDRQPGSVPA